MQVVGSGKRWGERGVRWGKAGVEAGEYRERAEREEEEGGERQHLVASEREGGAEQSGDAGGGEAEVQSDA